MSRQASNGSQEPVEWVGRLDVRATWIDSRIGFLLREQLDRSVELCQKAPHLLDAVISLTQVLQNEEIYLILNTMI